MAKRGNSFHVTNKALGIALIVALLIQYVLPRAGLGGLSSIGVLIYLIVAIYLLFF